VVLFTDETCFHREGIFKSHNRHFVQKQTVMQHLFNATNSNLWSNSGWALLMNWFGLVTLTAQCTDLPRVSG
jgi:hypothetical protein